MKENQLIEKVQNIGGNHWLGGIIFSKIGWCLMLFELNARRFFQYYMCYAKIHYIRQKDAFHDNNILTVMKCLFRVSTRCGWAWNYM